MIIKKLICGAVVPLVAVCLSASATAGVSQSQVIYAPQSVRGMILYGNLQEKQGFDQNIVLDFRAPLMKQGRIAFYPTSGKSVSTPKNSGVYSYKRIGPKTASFIYVSKKGLKQPYFFHFDMAFTKPNAGTFITSVFTFKNKIQPSVRVRPTSLNYVKTQTGTFSFKAK